MNNIEPSLKNKFGEPDLNECKTTPDVEESISKDQQNGSAGEQLDTGVVNNPEEVGTNDTTKEAVKPLSSWASLFKSADAPTSSFDNKVVEAPGILSIQMEQEKETSKDESKAQNSLMLISMSNDSRAISLAGIYDIFCKNQQLL